MSVYPVDENGTVTLGKVEIPVPTSVSSEAQTYLSQDPWADAPMPDEPVPMWYTREATDQVFQNLNAFAEQMYPVKVKEITIAGVRCHRITPDSIPEKNKGRVLINLHGGGFVIGSGCLVEAIPVAHLAQIEVIVVDYRLAPEHPYPAALDDVVAVYTSVLEDSSPSQVAIYGNSAGGFLTGQALARFQRDDLPMPACAGILSAGGNLENFGDTRQIFTLSGFYGNHGFPLDHEMSEVKAYLGGANADDPVLAPERSDLANFPPMLFITGTRDSLLSATSNFHRALLRAGREAELVVFDAMPHGHFYALHLPESRETFDLLVNFLQSGLDKAK